MPTAAEFTRWLEGYRDAFIRFDAGSAGELFSEQALYCDSPYAEPVKGRSNIVAYWKRVAEIMRDVEFGFQILAVTEDVGVPVFTTNSHEFRPAARSGMTGSSSPALTKSRDARSSGNGGWRSPGKPRQILPVWQLDRRARAGAPYARSPHLGRLSMLAPMRCGPPV